jgi:hypothetical protein
VVEIMEAVVENGRRRTMEKKWGKVGKEKRQAVYKSPYVHR